MQVPQLHCVLRVLQNFKGILYMVRVREPSFYTGVARNLRVIEGRLCLRPFSKHMALTQKP